MAHALKEPGWYRAALGTVIGAAFGFFLVVGLRLLEGLDAFQTEQTGYPQLVVPLITAPFGFLIGFGAFDYWFRWAAGKPTEIKTFNHWPRWNSQWLRRAAMPG